MQTSDILNVIERFPLVKERFVGVFPCDLIPSKMDEMTCLIYNLSKSGEKGTHWNALIRNYNNKSDGSTKHVYEIFDPLSTNFYVIQPYLKFKNATYYFNSQKFQDPESSVCGFMSLYFIISRMHNIYEDYNTLLSEIFEPSCKANTKVVLDFFDDFS
jgi:hypothetical protein